MKVSEAIELLKDAELKQLSLKDNKATVLGFINFGVLEIHKRFRLRSDEVTFTTVDGVDTYNLDGTDVNVPVDYSDHQILVIERVETDEFDIPLNVRHKTTSAKTPTNTKLILPELEVGTEVTVTYRSAPVFMADVEEEIPLPIQFFEALFNYVGYRGHSSVKGDIKSENNTHYQRFERSCDEIDWQGLHIVDDLETTKFHDRGFV